MEENIKEAMAAAHDNMQEKMQEKVAAGQTGSR